MAARAPPTSGPTMKTQRAARGAVFPANAAKTAGAMLLAGFTLVPVRPIPKMCTKVRVRPITRPPKEPCAAFLLVTPRIVMTKMKVSRISTRRPATAFGVFAFCSRL